MPSKINKVAAILRQDTGVGYYRLGQPTMFLDRITKGKCRITPFTGKNEPVTIGQEDSKLGWNDTTLMKLAQDADVIWTNIVYDYNEMIKMLDLREWSGAKWVVDIDDNLYAVSTDNPGSNNTKLLRDNFELCLRLADGVTVSVPTLKKLYGNLNKNIFVMPNGTDLDWWKKLKVKRHKGIRIGWRGAYGHKADINLVRPVIEEIQKNYDNVAFVSFGAKPTFKTEHHEWVDFLKFPKKLASLNLDIAIVPLVDSSYNRCKSNLAIQEFSALKVPVVASPTLNQKNMPVLYASTNHDWYEQLVKLIETPKLRKEQGQKQYKHVKDKYSMSLLVKPLSEWLSKLPRRKDIKPNLSP